MGKSDTAARVAQQMTRNVLSSTSKALYGKERVIRRIMVCLLAGGHVLIEDVPGIGKTTIVKALTTALGLKFRRIQFTPDLMPSDITGFNLYNPKKGEFVFQEGTINAQIVLADEINRTTPRTQSALLEAMQEKQVTVEGKTYPLPDPFMVLATQNPVEHAGTYPLPEAQLDRFMMRVSVGYPSEEEEMDIIALDSSSREVHPIETVTSEEEICWLRDQLSQVKTADEVKSYVLAISRASRKDPRIELGASPRASQMLMSASAALALMEGRDYVVPDDVKFLAHDILDHRLILTPQARGQGVTAYDLLEEILEKTAAPR